MSEDIIALSIPNFSGNEKKYVNDAIDSEWVSTAGAFISRFEEEIAKKVGVTGACACQSGTAGLHLCLRYLGVSEKDIVLVPTLTFIATINAVLYQCAEPIFFDCNDHMCIDVDQIEWYLTHECQLKGDKVVDKETGKTVKAIIPVHVFGDHCDMQSLMRLADKYHLYVIEDASESLGGVFGEGSYKGKYTGTVGHFGVYSFNGNKIITTGGGGMVVSEDADAVNYIRYLSQQAKDDALYFIHNEYGYNYRMTNLQAALGLAQLELLDNYVNIKRANYRKYCEKLEVCDYARMLDFVSGDNSNHWFYSFMLNEPDKDKRDRLIAYMNGHNIQVRPIWKLNNLQKPFRKYRAMDCSRAEKFYNSIINIPCSTNLTDEQIERVCKILLNFETLQ